MPQLLLQVIGIREKRSLKPIQSSTAKKLNKRELPTNCCDVVCLLILLFAAVANLFFICLFTIEALVKMYSVGIECYFASMFNRFDTVVIVFSWSEAALTYFDIIAPVGVSVLRCARLLRVFKVTRSGTVTFQHTLQLHFNKLIDWLID